MPDTIGERQPGYQTVDQKAAADKPVPLKNQKSFKASVAAFLTSFGILGGQLGGVDPVGTTFDTAQDTKNTVADISQAAGVRLDRAVNDMDGKPLVSSTPKAEPTAVPPQVKR